MSALSPGFDNPVFAAQRVFRAAMEAMARPGRIQTVAERAQAPALSVAQTALALTLFDNDTTVFLGGDTCAAADYLRFHCGCPVTDDPAAADFALIDAHGDWPPFTTLARGSADYPDRSTTVIADVLGLASGGSVELTGPGIQDTHRLSVTGLPEDFAERWAANRAGFPLGVDVFLCCADRFIALPRTVCWEAR